MTTAGVHPAKRLARLNGRMLRAFSRRTLDALRAALPWRLALPHLEPVLALNVAKEIEKDRLVIVSAASSPPDSGQSEDRITELLRASEDVDSRFLGDIDRFPVRIDIRYDEIRPYRQRRIRLLHETATRVLTGAATGTSLRQALREQLAGPDGARLLNESFRLYAEEVRSLGRSVKLPPPLAPLREAIARELLAIMLRVAWPLSQQIATLLARERRSPAAIDSPGAGTHT